MAVVIGVGVITFVVKKSFREAVLAGLFAAGTCAVGLHNLVG
ncbi:hypothetical protein [Streptomyces sp. NPDC046870]